LRPVVLATLGCLLWICLPGRAALACTSFCFDTPAGPVFAANCDLFIPGDGLVFANRRGIAKRAYRANTLGEYATWVSTYGSVTFSLAGREFAWGGMNEAGLVMTSMLLTESECADPDQRPPIGAGFLVQHLLDTCSTVAEAVRAAAQVMPAEEECQDHFLVADATGAGATIEFLDGRVVCRTGADLPVRAMTNMRYERALAAYERGGPRWWWSNPGRSAERFAGAAWRSESFDAERDTNAVAYAFETLTHVVAAEHTKWNIVWDLAGREVWFRSVASPTVKHVALADFDFSCDAPLLTLDMNAALAGDVAGAFRPCGHDQSLAVFSTFCARWGIEVTPEVAESLTELFESYACAHQGAPE